MQKKIFIIYINLILIGIMLTGLLTLKFVRTTYIENVENQMVTNANLINQFVEERISETSVDDVNFTEAAKKYSKEIHTRVTFVDVNGMVIGDSEIAMDDLDKIENHLYRTEIKKALKGEIGKSERISNTVNIEYAYIAVPIEVKNEIYGVTRLALPLTKIKSIHYEFFQNIMLAALCGLVVTAILAYRFANNVTRPIKEITHTAKHIANGNLKNKVYIKSKDEIGELAHTFNIMGEKLNDTITEIRDKNTKLQSILVSVNEALFAVDRSCKIMLINPVARELFDIQEEDVYGKHILEVVRSNKLHDILKDILDNNQMGQTEITVHYPERRILKINTNFIRLDLDPTRIIGIMALIQDVTEMRKLEKMRSDFVANVSHELKTPLTSIRGFIETLKSGAIDDGKVRNKFLDIIDIESERLTRLINSLLHLSAIENQAYLLKREKIHIKEVMNEIEVITERLIENKNLNYISEIESELPEIYGCRDRFKQMILNLIENAIKYTPENGEVRVLIYKRYDNIMITVKDTGIGIPKEDLPRLFERFYRVDKARTRRVGGTGLGLSIVKHIVLSFNGNIKVNSQVGKGSEFTIRIPI